MRGATSQSPFATSAATVDRALEGQQRGSLLPPALHNATDGALAHLAAAASEPAFEELVRRHRPALVAHAQSLTPGDRAEDVVQQGLTKAYLALRGGLAVEQPKAWLHRIVHNLALNEIRDNRRTPQPTEDIGEDDATSRHARQAHATVETAEGRERVRAFISEIHQLPEAQRQALVKNTLEGMSHGDIATQMSVSEGAVRQLIYRARSSLRQSIGTAYA